MSLTSDVLARATPTRLICRGGRWVLELTRLEAVDRDVFQPRVQRLEGSDSILALLRRNDEGQLLASGAAQLMRGARQDDDRAFDATDGDWVPSNDFSPLATEGRAPAADNSDLSRAFADLRAELMVLRASHTRLRERVMALEAAQAGTSALGGRLPRGGRTRRRSEPPPGHEPVAPAEANAAPLPAALAATQASPGLAPPAAAAAAAKPAAPVAAPPVNKTAASHSPAFDELVELAGGKPASLLGLPTLVALGDCLSTLMDAAPKLEVVPGEPLLWKLREPRACRLLDDSGKERGAIILDLTAAIQLGALLLALPRDEAERQIRENQPSDDVLLATSEICNNLTGPVNGVPKNEHVRSTALTSIDVTELPQVRASLNLAVDGGRVVLAMF